MEEKPLKPKITQIFLFGWIPLHRKGSGVVVHGNYEEFRWWEGFKMYHTLIQILILCRIITLRLHCLRPDCRD